MASLGTADFFSLREVSLLIFSSWAGERCPLFLSSPTGAAVPLCLALPVPVAFFSLREGSQFIPPAMLGNDVRFSSLRRRARLKEEKRTEKKFRRAGLFYAER